MYNFLHKDYVKNVKTVKNVKNVKTVNRPIVQSLETTQTNDGTQHQMMKSWHL